MNTNYKQLTRSTSNRMIAGVCAGLGEYLGIDPTIVRLADRPGVLHRLRRHRAGLSDHGDRCP